MARQTATRQLSWRAALQVYLIALNQLHRQPFFLLLTMKTLALSLFICLACSFQLVAEVPRVGRLAYGWATESIVPNQPIAIGGQYHTRISSQVHDPITVTAQLLKRKMDKGLSIKPMADRVIWWRSKATVENARKLVAQAVPDLDVSKIIVSATHTHTAPVLTDTTETDLHPYEFVRSWAYRIPSDQTDVMQPREHLEFLERQLALAIARAWQSRSAGEFSFCA